MINVALLKQTLAHIEANPGEWHQPRYRCGSGLCFAGWAVQLAGGQWYTTADEVLSDLLLAEPDEPGSYELAESDVCVVSADNRAERLLGLTEVQANRLFHEDNTRADLRLIVAELCQEAVQEEVSERLRQGLSVELTRDADGLHVTPLPEARIPGHLVGEHETYAVEHVGHRPGGDLDVVISATPHDHRPRTYLAFRRDAGEWRPLAGRDQDLESAVHRAEREQRFAGWDSPELAELLGRL